MSALRTTNAAPAPAATGERITIKTDYATTTVPAWCPSWPHSIEQQADVIIAHKRFREATNPPETGSSVDTKA